jgi:hypothetical protein
VSGRGFNGSIELCLSGPQLSASGLVRGVQRWRLFVAARLAVILPGNKQLSC